MAPTKSQLVEFFAELNPVQRQGGLDAWYTRPQTRAALMQSNTAVSQGNAWAKEHTQRVESAIRTGDVETLRVLARVGLPPGLRRAAYALLLQAPDSGVVADISPQS